jgi:phosphohistidine phosphatase
MNLFILRHASAGTSRANPLIDKKRPLDKEGKKHCLQLSTILNTLNIQFDLIISSPLKRSLQTASLVGTETGYEAKIMQSEALSPTATFKDFQALLQTVSGKESVLVVGHNPNISVFLGALLVPTGAAAIPSIRLRKGSLARVTFTRGPATLQGLIDPRVVRASYTTATRKPRRKTQKSKIPKSKVPKK